jgi:hypothetical protein
MRLIPGAHAVLAAAALLAGARPPTAELSTMPGAPRAVPRRWDAAAENARCEACHAEVAAEWRGSLHRASYVDPAYARALAAEPTPFCRGCHAPEAPPELEVSEATGAIGTACVTCHVTGDAVLAAPHAGTNRAPHRVTRDARFASALACAPCHEFDFPVAGVPRPRELMQSTVHEHDASPYAALACAECHMPIVGDAAHRHRSHAFPASRSPEVLRAAASVRAERFGPSSVRVTIAAGEVGHAFPTGDLFRRLTVSAEVEGGPRAERHLMRRFGERRVGLTGTRTQIGDDRVGVGSAERVVDLDLGPRAVGLPIRCRVEYERVEHPLSRDGEAALVDGRIPLAEALLPASTEETP